MILCVENVDIFVLLKQVTSELGRHLHWMRLGDTTSIG